MLQKPNDILEDLLHFYFSETIAAFPQSARRNLYGATFAEKFGNALKYFARSAKESFASSPTPLLENKVWLYVISDNNFNSLSFLENQIDENVYVTPYRYQKAGTSIVHLQHASRFRYLLGSLPKFLRLFFSGRKEVRRAWDAVFRVGGMYEYSLAILKQHRPKAIVFSNDTTLEPRSLMLAAKELGIPTFYIQHACIRTDWPPLKFTCSFLEGQDALDKYKACGAIEGDVKLIGVPKIDPYLSRKNTSKKVQNIGICSNLLDSISEVESVVAAVLEKFPNCKITYRPHPGDSRVFSSDNKALIRSNSREEKVFEFLLKQDLIIAGNTSIHYEAAMLNVVSIYYRFDQASVLDDTYGFVRNGLVEEAKSVEELVDEIRVNVVEKRDMGSKAGYYNAVLGTEDEGRSQELVVGGIRGYIGSIPKRVV